MRICIVCEQYGLHWTGVGNYTTGLVNGLAERGHHVTIVCSEYGECHKDVRIVKPVGPQVKPKLSNWFISAFLFGLTVDKLLNSESFDLIHYADARHALFSSTGKVPVVGTMHDYYFAEAEKNVLYYKRHYSDWFYRWVFYHLTKRLERKALGNLSFIISNSDYVREAIIARYGIREKATKTIYIGIHRTRPVSRPPGGNALSPRLLFVGSNFQRKGLLTLLQAINIVKEEFPHITLDVIGSDKALSYYAVLCKRLKMGSRVFFLGRIPPEKTRLQFPQYHLFVMPSLVEGFGLVFLEAMSAGVPAIGGNVGGTRELIRNNENGLLVDPNDPVMLAEKISVLLGDDSFRAQLIEEGFRTVDIFSIDRMIEETERLYRTLIL